MVKRRRKREDVVLSIVVRDDQVLLIERKGLSGNSYVFPGGKIEPTETEKEASEREVFEETGFDCRAIKKIGTRVHPITGTNMKYWLCEFEGGRYERDLHEYRPVWAPIDEISKLTGPTLFDRVGKALAKWTAQDHAARHPKPVTAR